MLGGSPAFQLSCQSWRRACVTRSLIGTPSWSLGTDPTFDYFAVGDTGLGHPDRVVSRDCGPTEVVGRAR